MTRGKLCLRVFVCVLCNSHTVKQLNFPLKLVTSMAMSESKRRLSTLLTFLGHAPLATSRICASDENKYCRQRPLKCNLSFESLLRSAVLFKRRKKTKTHTHLMLNVPVNNYGHVGTLPLFNGSSVQKLGRHDIQ